MEFFFLLVWNESQKSLLVWEVGEDFFPRDCGKMDAGIEKECSALGGLFQLIMNDMKVKKKTTNQDKLKSFPWLS